MPVGGNLIAEAAFAVLPELANILPEGVESVLKSLKDGGIKEVSGLLTTNFDEYLKSREGKVSSHLERTIATFWAEKLGDRILSRQNTLESMSSINPGRLDLEDEITLLECWQKRIKDACEKNFSALDDLFDYSGNLTIIDAIGDERDAEEFFWIGLKVNLLSWAKESGIPEAEGKLSGGMEKELKKPFFDGLKNKIGQVIQEDEATREAFKYAAAFQTIDLIKRLAEKTDVHFGELKFDLSKLQIDVGQMMEIQKAIRAETASPLRAIQMLLEERFPEMLERIEDKIDRVHEDVGKNLEISEDSNERLRRIEARLGEGAAVTEIISVRKADIGGSIDFADIVTGRSDNLAIDVIRGINAQAAVLYQRIVLKQDVIVRHGEIWRNFWQPYEFETQRNYANTRLINGEFVQDRICSRLMEAFSETESFGIANQTRLWLIGGAGVGKTSSLYHTFFKIVTSENSYPIPLLLQPRLFDEKAVNRLDYIEDDAEFLEQLMIIWLENRSIRLPAANLPDFLDGLKKALGNGKIAILIDSYDELARFKFQTQIFRSLINGTQVCVCASRPETYDNNEKDNDVLKIEDAWELETVKQFLGKRIPAENAFSGLLLRYISENQSADWLRNPRYLDLFVRINDDMFAGNGLNRSEEALTDILKGGGYALLKRIHDEAIDRLRRNLPQNSPLKMVARDTFERETTKRFCDIALTELTLGARNLSTDDYENDPYWRAVCSATDFLQKPFLNRFSGSYKLKFLNYNFVDYFLTEEIALQVYTDDKPIEHFHQWSNTLISYLVQYFFDDKENFSPKTLQTQVKKKLKSYGTSAAVTENGYRAVPDFEPGCCFMGINLMKLLIKLINRDENDLLAPEFMGEEYKNLYLKGVDLSGMRFIECDFTGSILENSIFEKTEFSSCNFSAVNFRESRAFQASFMECDFDFTDGPRDDSAVNGMIVHSVEFTGCKSPKGEKVGPETFLDFGARIKESRYAGEFGRRFRKQMADFSGKASKWRPVSISKRSETR